MFFFYFLYHSQAPFCTTIWEEYVWFTFSKQRSEVANSILQVDNSLAPCCPKVPMRRGQRQEHRIIDLRCVHIWYMIYWCANMIYSYACKYVAYWMYSFLLLRTWHVVYMYIYIYAYFDISTGFGFPTEHFRCQHDVFCFRDLCCFLGWKQSPIIWAMLKNPIVVQGISGISGLHLEHVRSPHHAYSRRGSCNGIHWGEVDRVPFFGSHEKGDSRQSQV